MKFSLKDITNNVFAEATNKLYSKLDGIIKKAFDDKFDDFKGEIQNHLVEWKNTIKDTIDIQYNSTIYYYIQYRREFNNNPTVSYNYTISGVQDSTVNILSQTILTFFLKVKKVYSDSNLLELFNERLTKSMSTFTFTFNNQNFSRY